MFEGGEEVLVEVPAGGTVEFGAAGTVGLEAGALFGGVAEAVREMKRLMNA